MPSGEKKESTPQIAKAKRIPPTNQFHFLTEAEKCPPHITQITTPRAIAIMTKPRPNKVRMLVPQVRKRGANKYSNPIMTMINISLLTTGEATKPKKPFLAGWLLALFRFGLNVLLRFALATELYLLYLARDGWTMTPFLFYLAPYFHSDRNDNGTAMSLLIEKFRQGVSHSSLNEPGPKQAFSIIIQSSYHHILALLY
jgi:hypothetical protein